MTFPMEPWLPTKTPRNISRTTSATSRQRSSTATKTVKRKKTFKTTTKTHLMKKKRTWTPNTMIKMKFISLRNLNNI